MGVDSPSIPRAHWRIPIPILSGWSEDEEECSESLRSCPHAMNRIAGQHLGYRQKEKVNPHSETPGIQLLLSTVLYIELRGPEIGAPETIAMQLGLVARVLHCPASIPTCTTCSALHCP